MRGFDVTAHSGYHRHGTMRSCDRAACDRTKLRDTIVYFGEKVAKHQLRIAQLHSEAADLAIFIGSSLKVLQHYKFIWQQSPKPAARKQIVIINLQPTPKDRLADLRIHGRCDAILSALLTCVACNL
jgi:NAD-dependent SIR2 family protein deacetylase